MVKIRNTISSEDRERQRYCLTDNNSVGLPYPPNWIMTSKQIKTNKDKKINGSF